VHLDHRRPALDKAAVALGSHAEEVDSLGHVALEGQAVDHEHRISLAALDEGRWVDPPVEVPVAWVPVGGDVDMRYGPARRPVPATRPA